MVMKRTLYTASLLLTLTSCQSLLTPTTRELTLRTDAMKTNCVDGQSGAVLGRDCFKVYTLPGNSIYSTFSITTVKGFTYQEGYESTILVSVAEVKNPPADASSLDYTLIRMIDQKRAP
jgi:hypothetical protein